MFRLGSRAGVLDTLFACNSIEATRCQSSFTSEDIPIALDKKGVETGALFILSVREAVAALSVGHGQGYIKCQCAGSCATLRCSCRKAGIACSSKCHGKAFICKNNDALYEVVDEATVEATEDVMEAVVVEKVQTRKVTKAKKANNKTNKKANKK